jgi:hypothetical protein
VHARVKTGAATRWSCGRIRSSALAHEGTTRCIRDQGIENRRETTNREGKTVTKKKKAAHKEIRTKRPIWVGRISDVATELNIGERYIYDLKKRGLPRISPGRYDVIKCFRWYCRYLQKKLVDRALPDDHKSNGVTGTAAGEMRHEMLSIEAELKKIELAEKREQLVSIDKVQKDMEAIVVEIRTRILALPPRLAAEVLGESDLAVSQIKIERSLKRALEALSQFDPDAVEPSSSTRSRT